jgi:hypothetical protein
LLGGETGETLGGVFVPSLLFVVLTGMLLGGLALLAAFAVAVCVGVCRGQRDLR